MYGRVALDPLRPCGFASLRQPDACGAGESVATATNVQREGRAPARPLPLRRFRSSGSSTLPLPGATRGDISPERSEPRKRSQEGCALAVVLACRPPANESMPKCNRKSQVENSTTNYPLPSINYQLPPTSSTLPHGHFPRRRWRRRHGRDALPRVHKTCNFHLLGNLQDR